MPLTPAFRKDIGDIKTKVIQQRDFAGAITLIQNLLSQQQQNQTYTDEEISLLRHALVHLESIFVAGTQTIDSVQENKISRVLVQDADKI